MNSATCLFYHKKTEPKHGNNYEQHDNRLSAVVEGRGFELRRSEGDGNCFFYSAAVALQNLEKDLSFSCVLESTGITSGMSITDVAYRLRELLVMEWTTNPDRYQPFLSTPLENEAQLFLQSGYFIEKLGNTMLLALANALSSP